MGLLDGRVAIVTGAGRGIGRGEAIELAREGARVVVNELDADAGQAVVDEIAAAGGEAVLDTGDCSEDDTARGLVGRAVDTFGRLDALVNNAGILRDRTVVKMSPEEWDSVIKVHLRGHFLPTHYACAHWKETGAGGRIVCTASTPGCSATSARPTTARPRPASPRSRRSSRWRWRGTACGATRSRRPRGPG